MFTVPTLTMPSGARPSGVMLTCPWLLFTFGEEEHGFALLTSQSGAFCHNTHGPISTSLGLPTPTQTQPQNPSQHGPPGICYQSTD